MQEFIAKDLESLLGISKKILADSQFNIFLLYGDLGSGKTQIVKSLIKLLGSTDKVTSPSYSIINEYISPKGRIYHIDLYRLNSIEEALEIGIEEYIYNNHVCFIEWPQLIEHLLPKKMHKIELHILDKDERRIIFS